MQKARTPFVGKARFTLDDLSRMQLRMTMMAGATGTQDLTPEFSTFEDNRGAGYFSRV